MPVLNIRNKLPAGEKYLLFIDGVQQVGTTLAVPETFCMRIEQYRISCSKKDTAETLGTMLTVLAVGGRASWGNEASSPYFAVWEGICQMSQDGEIELWLHEEGVNVNFVPWSGTVSFEVTEDRTGGRDPSQVGRWALMMAPLLLFSSFVCLVMFFAAGVFGIDPAQDVVLWVFKLTFLFTPLYSLFHIWKSVLRPFLGQKKTNWEKRMSRRLVVQIVVVTLLAGAAVFEVVSLYVFAFVPATFTIFPATVVLIIHLHGTTNVLEQAERSGIRSEALEPQAEGRCLRARCCDIPGAVPPAPACQNVRMIRSLPICTKKARTGQGNRGIL